MYEDNYWKPPQRNTRRTLLDEFQRDKDCQLIHSGKHIGNKHYGQMESTLFIERLVKRVIARQEPAFILHDNSEGYVGITETTLGSQIFEAVSMVGLFDSSYDYSEHVLVFLHSTWLIASTYGIPLSDIEPDDVLAKIHYADAMNDIVETIRHGANQEWFRRSIYDRDWEAKSKAEKIKAYTASICEYYESVTNVRVDLSYLETARPTITIDDVYSHLDQLLYLKDFDPLFKYLVGYVWHLEQGDQGKGFHIHCSFMFRGSEMSGDIKMGLAILSLWKRITGSKGSGVSCNSNKHWYDKEKVAVGYNKRTNAQGVNNMINANSYLAKAVQHLRIKPKARRAFGTGDKPDFHNKPGRKSQKAPTWRYSDNNFEFVI